jgi:hypothetical protein
MLGRSCWAGIPIAELDDGSRQQVVFVSETVVAVPGMGVHGNARTQRSFQVIQRLRAMGGPKRGVAGHEVLTSYATGEPLVARIRCY